MPAAILARLALLEARRGGLGWLGLLAVVVGLALAGFLSQLALTESRMLQAAVVAALLRVCAVFLIAGQVVASVRREIDDKRLELALSLPLSRAAQYLGRLGGFIALGALLALDRATRTDWLLYGAPDGQSFGLGVAGVLLYAALLAAAGVFDFQRRAS